jgi:biopolymer transport protein ExbD
MVTEETVSEAEVEPGGDGGDGGVVDFVKKDRGVRKQDMGGALNINSMMDILTILLVFILVSISNDPLSITQDDFLLLARSSAEYDAEDTIAVHVTKQKLIVNNAQVVKVDCTVSGQVCQPEDYKRPEAYYSIDKSFKEDGEERSFLIDPLHKVIEELAKQQKDEAKELGREYKPICTMILDKDIPFRLIAEVVHTVGMAGLSQLRFAVIKGGGMWSDPTEIGK